VLDSEMPGALREGFAKHPWVSSVAKVELAPPRAARVVLVYRQAVTAVVVDRELAGTGDEGNRPLRGVDESGILLPKKAKLAGLPVLENAPRPTGGEGQSWGDPIVVTAVQAALLLAPHWQSFGLTKLNWTPDGVVVWGPLVKILWGQGGPGEAAGKDKLERLAAALEKKHHGSDWLPIMEEIDLRPPGKARWRWIVMPP
jgi:hypothetical protein